MRIGLIVDGESELAAMPKLFPILNATLEHHVVGIVQRAIQPKAPTSTIVLACNGGVRALKRTRPDRAIVLLDREDLAECPGSFAERIREGVARVARAGDPDVRVVVKDRTFENWLIADVMAVKGSPGRFNLTNAMERQIARASADHVDADQIIRSACIGGSYQKTKDSARIMRHASIDRIAANSRSFRRFLRVLDHPDYRDQSRNPTQR